MYPYSWDGLFSDGGCDDFSCSDDASYTDIMDDIYSDDGLSEAGIDRLSIKHARDMLASSCTLEDKLGDIAAVRWTIRHRLNKLPELVRVQILEFYPSAQLQLRGQKLLGLHNGYVYYFQSLASSRARGSMCHYNFQALSESVADYCVRIGCPVSPHAPVIRAIECFQVADVGHGSVTVSAVLPSEFAVLVPDSPCSSRVLEDFEDLSEEERSEHAESDDLSRAPAPRARTERQSQTLQSREVLPQDRKLYRAVKGLSGVRAVTGSAHGIRQLLRDGANPAWISEDRKSAASLATGFLESSKNYLERLLKRQFCPHQAQDFQAWNCTCINWSYLDAVSYEHAREEAQTFLEKLEEQKESVALLSAAETVWAKAAPSKRMQCSENFLCGRGVRSPELEFLDSSIAAIPKAEASRISQEDVWPLAACMWDLAQQHRSLETLCCREAEVEAMSFEESVSRQVELKERRMQRAREKAPRENRQEDSGRRMACNLMDGDSCFSKRGRISQGLGFCAWCRTLIDRAPPNFFNTGIIGDTPGIGPRVCCYYLQGRCSFGEDCRFSHDDQDGPCQFGDECWLGHGDEL